MKRKYILCTFMASLLLGGCAGQQNQPIPIEKESDMPDTGVTAATGAETEMITADAAKSSALAHAGLAGDQVTFVDSKLDYEDGRQVYEIEFYTTDYKEYDYEIDAYTGEVISFDYDAENYAATPAPENSGLITAEKAKELALEKVPGASASDIQEFKTDYDDGRTEYEGKIIYDGMEYEFEIDASNGSFLDWETQKKTE